MNWRGALRAGMSQHCGAGMGELTLEEAIKQAGPARVRVLGPLLKDLPTIISRGDADRLTGGLVGQKTLARDDGEGKGPRVRMKVRQKVVYPKDYFLEYLETMGVKVVVAPEF